MRFLISIQRFYCSSIGKKLLVAATGIILLAYVFGHMVGNLLFYQGPEALNHYAHFLKTSFHGAGVWIARIGLLTAFVVHIVATTHVTRQNRDARTHTNAQKRPIRASKASRTMMISGLIVLLFVVYHLLHFTFGLANDYLSYRDSEGLHDVYRMVKEGFSWWPASVFYIFSMAFLCFHMSHGFSSVFQTLGFRTQQTWPLIRGAGHAFAVIIFVGNCSIPLTILAGLAPH